MLPDTYRGMSNHCKDFKIPTSFYLFGHEYRVVIVDDLYDKHDCHGLADDDVKTITLQSKKTLKNKDGVEFVQSDDFLVEIFYHELTHIILDAACHQKLSENEILVGLIGKALMEIYKTSKYAS